MKWNHTSVAQKEIFSTDEKDAAIYGLSGGQLKTSQDALKGSCVVVSENPLEVAVVDFWRLKKTKQLRLIFCQNTTVFINFFF